MDILRFTTAGSVDDGKSTLIGRLLHDTHNIKTDILQSLSKDANINLAHITDGLRAERQRNITIDVAYKYFSTKCRKYIITDAPGHFQYTRNLVTGASNVDVMIILIDAQNGITDQTYKHTQVASFLNIPSVVVAINKMDLLNYNEKGFTAIKNEYLNLAEKLKIQNISFIPISALHGDNVSAHSEIMPWYQGPTLLQYLESYNVATESTTNHTRVSVQYVVGNACYGKLISGRLKIGETVNIYPENKIAVIKRMLCSYNEVNEIENEQNLCLFFNDDFVPKRGDILTKNAEKIICDNKLNARICWLDAAEPLSANKEYLLRIHTAETNCRISCNKSVNVNDFADVIIETKYQIAYDAFSLIPATGRGIIIDPETNYTSGAFVIP
jgi:sulfate adenylyltransferase subunit 1